MSKLTRALLGVAGVAVCGFALGFVTFAVSVTRSPGALPAPAEGIVVLTGGELRIREGAKLLRERRGQRLLISGVNRLTTRRDLMRLSGLRGEAFDCCVDVGYRALNTIGNADETRTWVLEKGFRKLIIVTSSYHMPRSLAELSLALPNIELVPHAVVPPRFVTGSWWLNPAAVRVLMGEYLKFIPAATRLAVDRLARSWQDSSVASADGSRRLPT